jgi:hypothetical protein
MTDPDIGVVNLTWDKVHDYEPGDELHVVSESSDLDSWSKSYSINKFLSKTEQSGEVIYEIERRFSKQSQEIGGQVIHTFNHDTIAWTPPEADPDFDLYAGEPIVDGEYAYSATGHIQNYNSKTLNVFDFYLSYEDCWDEVIWDGCLIFLSYRKGLGGPYYGCSYGFTELERTLVYYKKGDETWGTPLIITSAGEPQRETAVRAFPNPARERFSIEVGADVLPAILEVKDINGKTVLQKPLVDIREEIHVGSLPAGIYIYRIISHKTGIYTGRLVLQ